MSDHLRLLSGLVAIGAGWGVTIPLNKIAVSTGFAPSGLIFWQLAFGMVVLGAILLATGRRPILSRRALATLAFVALLGTLVPNWFSYRAAAELPAGIMAIVIASVPMFALPVATALGLDRPTPLRLAGLGLGLAAVALIGLPEASLPDRAALVFLPLALVAPLCYAIEGNGLAKFGLGTLDPISVLFGASVLGLVALAPWVLSTGAFVPLWGEWSPQKSAVIANGILHPLAYAGYVWMVGRGGPVFAAQVSYIVTGFGVLWSMALLDERYAATVWLAIVLMFAGLALVQPKPPSVGEGSDVRV